MRRPTWVFALSLLAPAGSAAGQPLRSDVAPDVIEGTLVAAACVDSKQISACNQHTLVTGQPAGLMMERRFTMLLIDGRILAQTCTISTPGKLRISGILHRGGLAMSVFRIEQNCGQGWTVVDLPHTGTLAQGAGGGDE